MIGEKSGGEKRRGTQGGWVGGVGVSRLEDVLAVCGLGGERGGGGGGKGLGGGGSCGGGVPKIGRGGSARPRARKWGATPFFWPPKCHGTAQRGHQPTLSFPHAQEVVCYAAEYCTRNALARVVTSGGDMRHFAGLLQVRRAGGDGVAPVCALLPPSTRSKIAKTQQKPSKRHGTSGNGRAGGKGCTGSRACLPVPPSSPQVCHYLQFRTRHHHPLPGFK
jgi:hypothetical protein